MTGGTAEAAIVWIPILVVLGVVGALIVSLLRSPRHPSSPFDPDGGWDGRAPGGDQDEPQPQPEGDGGGGDRADGT
jgi:hypothetical protein